MKLNAAAQAAWNQPTATPAQGQAQSYQNGTQQQQPQQPSLHAPPGVPPASFSQQPTQQGQNQAQGQGAPFVGNGTAPGNGTATTGNGGNGTGADAQGQSAPVPQTPAQQVLMSPADRWGLLSLLAMIKNADPDQALLSVGTDLGTMGLDMQQQGCASFLSPFLFRAC
jgi:CCR4-NOT transcription complex subunit 2